MYDDEANTKGFALDGASFGSQRDLDLPAGPTPPAASTSAQVIDMRAWRAGRLIPRRPVPRPDPMTGVGAIQAKLMELAAAVDQAGREQALSPMLLDGILIAIMSLQRSMREYQQSALPPRDPAC